MIQLIDSLPFTSSDFDSLKADWTRFKDGLVTFDQIPDAICGEFECEAEIQKSENEIENENESESEKEGDSENNGHGLEDKLVSLNSLPSGNGKLIITASKLYWISNGDGSKTGWSIDYQNVLLHAISKPSESRPYIYLQLSCNKIIDMAGNEISQNNDDEDDEKFVEVNLYVDNDKVVDDIFVALSECASLNPCDDEESESEGEFEESESESGEFEESEADEPKRKINKVDEERFEDAAEK